MRWWKCSAPTTHIAPHACLDSWTRPGLHAHTLVSQTKRRLEAAGLLPQAGLGASSGLGGGRFSAKLEPVHLLHILNRVPESLSTFLSNSFILSILQGFFLMGSKGFSNIKWSMCRAGLAENSGPGPAPGAQHDHRPPGLQRQRPRCDSSSLLRGRHPCQDVTHSSPSAHAWHSLLSADTSGMRRAKGPDGSVGQDAAAWALNTLKRVLRVSGFLG